MASGWTLDGVEAWQSAVVGIVGRVDVATTTAVREGAHVVQAAMQHRAGEGGRHAKGTPTPAVRGRGPAVITGNFRRSFRVGPIVSTRTSATVRVGPTAVQSRRLELDYDYPSVRPGLRDAMPSLAGIYARAWRKAITR